MSRIYEGVILFWWNYIYEYRFCSKNILKTYYLRYFYPNLSWDVYMNKDKDDLDDYVSYLLFMNYL